MKARASFWRVLPLVAGMVVLWTACPLAAENPRPVITAVRPTRTQVLVEVNVPAGYREITIEGRARFGRGAWEPRAVARTDGSGGTITVRLEFARQLEILRVKANPQTTLPASFYTGTNAFNAPADTTTAINPGGPMIYTTTGFGGIEVRDPNIDTTGGSAPRDVVESDIWKISGNTMYYFNQNRGLQIIDLTNPDQSTVRGTFALPAVGEQMYLLNQNHALLLARESCDATGYQQGRVVVVNVAGQAPVETATLTLSGRIQESRLVGTALYVSSAAYRSSTNSTNIVWEYGTMVESFDLADPARPVRRNHFWFAGYSDDVVSATELFLFVSTRTPANYYSSDLHVLDITAPDGTMSEYATLQPTGHVKDKFKLHHNAGVLTTIAEDWRASGTNRMRTCLETWRVPDPRTMGPGGVARLGEVTLGYNESLHATRFDGNRAYIVTFFRVDPLWVVDLSDPAIPRIAGELQVPGWSTYIQPLGDRLVAVGVEGGRVAVSLFDVREPARPALYNKVLLGQSHSWSEANNDEKAFTVLPSANLILVPYSGNTTNGWASQVQLIDLNETNLVARGIIEHQLQPRRATLFGDRILSLSGWELISVDASDRDQPLVKGTTDLAWPVSRVFVAGNYLLQLTTGNRYYYGGSTEAVLRISPKDDPNHILNTVKLGAWPVAAADLRGGRLFVVQTPNAGVGVYYPWAFPAPGPVITIPGPFTGPGPLITTFGLAASDPKNDAPADTNNFRLTVFDLATLPQLPAAGRYSGYHEIIGWNQQWEPVWPSDNLLVLVNTMSSPYWYFTPYRWYGPIGWYPYYYYHGGGQMLAFDVAGPNAPALVSTVNLSTNNWFNFSKPYAADNRVYLSHGGEWLIEPIIVDPAFPEGEEMPFSTRLVNRQFLDVVDFTDPVEPLVRKPVNLPGALAGISHAGNIVYTAGYHYNETGTSDYVRFLDAGAYDGTQFNLLASLKLPSAAGDPLVREGNIYYPESSHGTNPSVTVHWLALDTSGQFAELGKAAAPGYFQGMQWVNRALAVHTYGQVQLFDTTQALTLIGQKRIFNCFSLTLTGADGSPSQGLWVPLENYGVLRVPAAERTADF